MNFSRGEKVLLTRRNHSMVIGEGGIKRCKPDIVSEVEFVEYNPKNENRVLVKVLIHGKEELIGFPRSSISKKE